MCHCIPHGSRLGLWRMGASAADKGAFPAFPKNLIFLTIESPTIKVDGENRDEEKKAVGLLGWTTHHPKEQRKKTKR